MRHAGDLNARVWEEKFVPLLPRRQRRGRVREDKNAAYCVSADAVHAGFAAIDVYQFDNEQQEQRFRILSEELRCPKCQNQSIADSDAGIAQDMRTRVHTMILEGKSDEDIVDYFVSVMVILSAIVRQ